MWEFVMHMMRECQNIVSETEQFEHMDCQAARCWILDHPVEGSDRAEHADSG